MDASNIVLWYTIQDTSGNLVAAIDAVPVAQATPLWTLRKQIHHENKPVLGSSLASQLSFTFNQTELKLSELVPVDTSEDNPLVVVVALAGGTSGMSPCIMQDQHSTNTNINRNAPDMNAKVMEALVVIQKDIAELKVTSLPYSETEIGRRTLKTVKENRNFYVHEDDPQKDPMLTPAEYDYFQSIKKWKEVEFNIKMTEIFQTALGPDVTLVNSEQSSWLSQGGDKSTNFRPDFTVCLKGLHCYRKELGGEDVKSKRDVARDANDTIFYFGVPPEKLLDMICILESKVDFSETRDFGQVVRYLQHMGEFSSAVLFDRKKCWLEVSWNVGGSKEKFVTFVLNSLRPWSTLILDACKYYNVQLVESDAFLGAGAVGRVFKVYRTGTNGRRIYFALKVVLQTKHLGLSLLNTECGLLKQAHDTNVVVSVAGDFKRFEGSGAALLISPVGKPICRSELSLELLEKIGLVMYALHEKGFQHGDPRLENLIVTSDDGELMWIDLMESLWGEYGWREDATMLSNSLLNKVELSDSIKKLIAIYGVQRSRESCLNLVNGWWVELVKNGLEMKTVLNN
ncbi:hypothetical protein BCR33DRAFT_724537 [Rhizoclosmatium globosum]|uniref:Protein kinase domain-containing protein n=1 Tax=Rhizoclosmatium globosum TaxID=329046 RepID=A0A1Y2B732_9FUNG|nr:hypothetical protein BCR33DRAFT_724537 [Rhizoclosmatium globosum]|eukprot:ORY29915.1 hypothetical protein BCR33DRAFT_724537 [Rhizoclosmatium globosum]